MHAYRDALVGYFTEHQAALSQDSLARLERNPLRILDSKDERDRRIVADAPTIAGYLTDAGRRVLRPAARRTSTASACRSGRTRASCAASTTTATPRSSSSPRKLGAQGTVMARRPLRRAGRGDGRPADAGRRLGRRHRASGHAAAMTRRPRRRPVAVVPVGDSAEAAALDVLQTLRHAGIRAEMAYRGNLRRRMERANRIGARAAVIIGEDDIARGVAQVKNLATGEQEAVALAEIAARLR